MIPSFLFTCFCASSSSQTLLDGRRSAASPNSTKLHRSARLCHSNASPALKALISWITIARPAVQTIRFPYMECHLSSCVTLSKSCIMLGGTLAKEDWKLGISDSVEEAPAACCRPGCLSQGSPPVTALYLLPFGSQPYHTYTHMHTQTKPCTHTLWLLYQWLEGFPGRQDLQLLVEVNFLGPPNSLKTNKHSTHPRCTFHF